MNTPSFIPYFVELWNITPITLPSFSQVYPVEEQKKREFLFNGYTEKFKTLQEDIRNGKTGIDQAKFFRAFSHFMKSVYNYSDEALSIILHPDMVASSRTFFSEARAFDPLLKSEELYQALRNVWIMNGLQLLLGKKAELTPSIFGYSLLYPYTDNILDDPSVSREEKVNFSKRFERRLHGEGVMALNHRENKINELVGKIELQYPRQQFPQVHDSLLAIHRAQTRSLQLIKGNGMLSGEDVLSICFEKGGASVLADGFLVESNLTEDVQKFLYGYGIWLQLLDDIQDISEDLSSGMKTLFSSGQASEERMQLANRTFHFGRSVMEDIKHCPSEICAPFGQVILQSIEMMQIQSIGIGDHYFSQAYCSELSKFSPLRFTFLKENRKKGNPGRFKLIARWMESNL